LLRSFLIRHARFADLLVTRRFQEATQLLDGMESEQGATPEIAVARCYLFLDQDRLEEAWQAARSYHGADRFELPYMVGRGALRIMTAKETSRTFPSPAARTAIVDLGLQAESEAISVRKDSPAPVFFKSRLLQEKSKLASDPGTRESLAAEARQLQALAEDLYAQGGAPDPFAAETWQDAG
jgi:hypothetical protein